ERSSYPVSDAGRAVLTCGHPALRDPSSSAVVSAREAFENGEQGRVILVAPAGGDQGVEELRDERGGRERDTRLARLVERDPQVLGVQAGAEAGRELVLDEVAAADLHALVGADPAREHVEERG